MLEIYLYFCLIVVVFMLLSLIKVLILFKPVEKKAISVAIIEWITSILKCFIPIYNAFQLVGFIFILLSMPNRLYDAINKYEKVANWRHE